MDFIVTTSLRQDQSLVQQAKKLAQKFSVTYVERRKRSLKQLLADYRTVLMIYQDQLVLTYSDGSQLYFHPDTAMLRSKAAHDPLVNLLAPAPKSVLDTTMGLASDSIVMAAAGHQVTALEVNPLIHLIVSHGLQTFKTANDRLNRAMRSIKTFNQEALSYMNQLPSKSVDTVYADPMFSHRITESSNLNGLIPLVDFRGLSEPFIQEAQRVARQSIIIKAHFRDDSFERFGFVRQIRPNQKFHYGIRYLS
ncbi:class I SAM-dependent methyltransferase [Streptococcus dentasini]